ncbi:phospholipid scramblase 2-like isoform X2 [Mercenaria mercenaria]|uniref:phospholipid scramblase 2-like isoform X2 n=1 Tax=Mercenaria mercenaria TaxID=6596 RepID=UPI00234E758B|nr:phospholipid scramblase 2-like isoform X2 [Mercenaria mercenaria]
MCPCNRGFTVNVTDNKNLQIMRFMRDFKYCTGCCCCGEGCCNMTVKVESPYGRYLGKATLANSKWATHIKILDETDKHVFTIWIPCCVCQDVCCPDDIVIPITDPTLTQQIGRISKVWRGCCVEAIGDADTFRVECIYSPFLFDVPANFNPA